MYENHRKSFRGERRDYDEDRAGDERARNEGRSRSGRSWGPAEDEANEWNDRPRAGYASTFRGEEDYGRYGGYDPERSRGSWRESQGGGNGGQWSHDAGHRRYGQGASSFGYGAGQPYGGDADSRYFTGQQGSWAVRGASGNAGGRTYGADYREHGYGSRQDERGFWDRASDEVASWFGDEEAARRREQDHRGRGPMGYTRSDERIHDDANDRLTEDSLVDASSVTVTVKDAEITLDGTVPSRAQKRRAEDVVENISGVKHVQNNLRVADAATGSGASNASSWTAASGSASNEGGTLGQSGTATTSRTA